MEGEPSPDVHYPSKLICIMDKKNTFFSDNEREESNMIYELPTPSILRR